MSWAEPTVQGNHDVRQPAHDGGTHFSGTVEGTAAPMPAWSVPWCWRAWLARLRAPGEGLDPVAVAGCKSAISVGEARWSGPLELPQCLPTAPLHCLSVPPDSSSTLSQCLQTAPLHCLSVPPDSSSTLSQCLQTAPLHCLPVPPDSSSTLSQCLQTAPLHCLPVPPDSSATLSPGWL